MRLHEGGIRFERFITNSCRIHAQGRQPECGIFTTIRVNIETYSDRIAFRRAQQHQTSEYTDNIAECDSIPDSHMRVGTH